MHPLKRTVSLGNPVGYIGESHSTQMMLEKAQRAARSNASILLLGETGVGKDKIARFIHLSSLRASSPFTVVNCAAVPESLFESELFGYEKGSFTGANQQRLGLFEVTNGGTIFLDEVAELKAPTQAKLLRVLQDGEFTRIGGSCRVHVDVRIIAATNKDLSKEMRNCQFREDLFFRLNVITISVPPLRERGRDILILAKHFVEEHCRTLNRPLMHLTYEAVEALVTYDWPGNVRQLDNVMHRAVIMSTDTVIRREDLMLEQPGAPSPNELPPALLRLPFHRSVEVYKRMLLQHVIAKNNGSQVKAAVALNLQPSYLCRLCKKLAISKTSLEPPYADDRFP